MNRHVVVHLGVRDRQTGEVVLSAGEFDDPADALQAESRLRKVLTEAEAAGITITAQGTLRCPYGSQPDRNWTVAEIQSMSPTAALGLSEKDQAVHYLLRESVDFMSSYVGSFSRSHGLEQPSYLSDERDFSRGLPAGVARLAAFGRYPAMPGNPLYSRWRACPNDLIGGWCVVLENETRTLAEGAMDLADFMTQEMAEHIAIAHNHFLEQR